MMDILNILSLSPPFFGGQFTPVPVVTPAPITVHIFHAEETIVHRFDAE